MCILNEVKHVTCLNITFQVILVQSMANSTRSGGWFRFSCGFVYMLEHTCVIFSNRNCLRNGI